MPDLTSMRNIGPEMARKLTAAGIRAPEEPLARVCTVVTGPGLLYRSNSR